MDPDQVLQEARDAAELIEEQYNLTGRIDPETAHELADRLQALDQWITKGGCLPAAWKDGQRDAAR